MKKSYFSIILMSSMLLLSGCGGSDSDDSNNGQNTGGNNSGGNNNGGSTTTTGDWTNEDAVNWITHSAVTVVFPEQFLDVLIYDTDGFIFNEAECSSGSYTNTNNTVTFNNCKTNFLDDDGVILSGKVSYSLSDSDESFSYSNFNLIFPDNSKAVINGKVDFVLDSETNTIVKIDDLKVVSDETYEGKNYSMTTALSDYTATWSVASNDEFLIEASGALAVIDSPFDDFSIKFNTTDVNRFNNNINPYDGGLKVVDANNAKNYSTLDYNSDAATLLYQSYANDKLVINRTLSWEDVYDF
uniref:hypothetical protein n=1 Tax=uncultured Acinetobacter sp. TaxID=165433 RepID=UPI00262B32C8|nr:hypothetical protein [uncultured Acinetobacter sp.]